MQRSATEIAPDDIVQAAKAYMTQARAESTHRAYGQAWALFEGWCKEHGREPCPATAATMTAWMAALARATMASRARASINLYLSAIVAPRTAGYPFVVTLQRSKSLQAEP